MDGGDAKQASSRQAPALWDEVTPGDERPGWYTREVKRRVQLWHKVYVEELILRRKPLPPSKHGRQVPLDIGASKPLVDDRRGHEYISNSIRSSRYNVWNFLPKQFFFQATRLSNFYFICIGIPQAIPGFSTTGSYTTILPVAFFILLTIFKEGYDDYRRHRLDKVENESWSTVLRPRHELVRGHASARLLSQLVSRTRETCRRALRIKLPVQEVYSQDKECDQDDTFHWTNSRWCDLKVGDVLRLKRDDPVPADVALLYADGEHGVAYIETMALDGETNLKTKQAPLALYERCQTIAGLRSCMAHFVLEDPNPNLYDFSGKVSVHGQVLPLTLNEIVYRGSVVRNTKYAIGIIINTGEECKIRMNANQNPKAKTPRLERYANQVVLTLIAYVVLLSVGLSVGYLIWQNSTEQNSWYLNDAAVPFKQIIIGFLIMFNNVIPLALYVSLEIVKIGQMLMIQSDVRMYDRASNTPMVCNTNTILENLGQVGYVLSDKTGTLTENVMRFRGMSIGGYTWMHRSRSEDKQSFTASTERLAAPPAKPLIQVEKTEDIKAADMKAPAAAPTGITVCEQEILATPAIEISEPGLPKARHPVATAERTTMDLLHIIRQEPESAMAHKAREFILGMALCHTALPELKDGQIDFQASSPDELALVRAAQDLGVLLVERSTQRITLSITHSTGNAFEETYQILDVIEFSSKRKRMSVAVRCPDGRVWLVCKGADSAIIPRLQQAGLATRKSVEVRRSMDIERELQRRSEAHEPRNSFGARPSLNVRGRSSLDIRVVASRKTLEIPQKSREVRSLDISDDSIVFRRCFQHIDDFATDGLRTLLFAHKYLDESEYQAWKKVYHEATTSLVDRQQNIESAGEVIEQGLELLGASAIEDKLQKGVPETIDRLRRANIRIWVLTGDKRETAINIAHSARICQPSSLIYVLDATRGDLHGQITEVTHDADAHRVAVIDGHTLGIVLASPSLHALFYRVLLANIDSVIVCRASPAQKAAIVHGIRTHPAPLPARGLTLAIGDGANDIAMIQAAHVGVGISGREGLQAARVADYSIAQFRSLGRLLLVHGRHSYSRTASFVLLTFWKEMFFYIMQAIFQREVGYSGSSLYEAWSLTVLNTLFTSLCVIVPGIFEQDLRATTLLAVPELYVYGPRDRGLNLAKYGAWMVLAGVDGVVVWFVVWGGYGKGRVQGDNGLFAMGDLLFSLGILWTNWKILVIETNYKTVIVGGALLITVAGWWIWNVFMASVYMNNLSPFDVRHGFTQGFGREPAWWLTLVLGFLILSVMEIVYGAAKRSLMAEGMWPVWRRWRSRRAGVDAEDLDLELWQEMERNPVIWERLKEMAGEEELGDEDEDEGGKVKEGVA